jgi:hypothetical protein
MEEKKEKKKCHLCGLIKAVFFIVIGFSIGIVTGLYLSV